MAQRKTAGLNFNYFRYPLSMRPFLIGECNLELLIFDPFCGVSGTVLDHLKRLKQAAELSEQMASSCKKAKGIPMFNFFPLQMISNGNLMFKFVCILQLLEKRIRNSRMAFKARLFECLWKNLLKTLALFGRTKGPAKYFHLINSTTYMPESYLFSLGSWPKCLEMICCSSSVSLLSRDPPCFGSIKTLTLRPTLSASVFRRCIGYASGVLV